MGSMIDFRRPYDGTTCRGYLAEVHRYDARHAFANDKSPAYHASSARLAWARTMAFLGKHL